MQIAQVLKVLIDAKFGAIIWPNPMQDSPICNAGAGSNLTVGGRVECDASVMAGDGAFGAVGTVSGCFAQPHALSVEWRE